MRLKKFLDAAVAAGADEAEVYLSVSRSTSIEVLKGSIESINIKDETGIGLRTFRGGRLGFAYMTDPNESSAAGLAARAAANAKNAYPDPNNQIPLPEKQEAKLDLFDGKIDQLSEKEKIEAAVSMEKASYEFDKRVSKTEKAVYQDSEAEVLILNSKGMDAGYRENLCGSHIEIIAEENGLMETGYCSRFSRFLDSFDPMDVGRTAAQRAVELLRAGSAPSQKLTLVLPPFVACEFLDATSPLFSSDFVQKGKSALAGKLGDAVASNSVTIIDDGLLPGGIGTSPFDAEGVPTGKTVLVENGKLKSYLYNSYTAKKDKVSSTGNAVRGGFSGTPQVGTTNMYIKKGSIPPAELIKNVVKGLFVTRVMGMHTVNPISGDFSVGAAGILIERGKKTSPVRGITIAGNLIETLRNISEVGNDLEFEITFGSPTLVIPGISIGGS